MNWFFMRWLATGSMISLATANAHEPAIAPDSALHARLFLRIAEENGTFSGLSFKPACLPGARIDLRKEGGFHVAELRFPIQWWRWSQAIIAFTPESDGFVELMLAGPWAENSLGKEIRREILWDDLSSIGTTLTNGGFEKQEPSGPVGWKSPWRPYPAGDSWPLGLNMARSGDHYAASWHGRPLCQSLQIRRDQPVEISLHTRAATPPGFQIPPVMRSDSLAHHTIARLKRGVNLGNCWESAPGEYRVKFDSSDVDDIANQGFDHIRVPVAWHHHIQNGLIDPTLLEELEPVLKRAIHQNLRILLVWQNHPQLMAHPERESQAFIDGWQCIAAHFQHWPSSLYFDLLNEPSGNLSGTTLNSLYSRTIECIRANHPHRTLFVEPGTYATVAALDHLVLPANDANLIVSIHCYEPFPITHQGAAWVGLEGLSGLIFPGPPANVHPIPLDIQAETDLVDWLKAYHERPAAENPSSALSFEPILAQAAAWSARFGRPVHIGEFGATRKMDSASRAAYAYSFSHTAESHQLPWCWWEWKAGFGCWDADRKQNLLDRRLGSPVSGR